MGAENKAEANTAEARFIQIAATRGTEDAGHVYALDQSGRVWEYDFNHRRWRALEDDREPIFTH
jgi:outer membrane protein assembly factor BamB